MVAPFDSYVIIWRMTVTGCGAWQLQEGPIDAPKSIEDVRQDPYALPKECAAPEAALSGLGALLCPTALTRLAHLLFSALSHEVPSTAYCAF